MSIAYASRIFEFSDVHALLDFGDTTHPRCINAIRYLRLDFDIDVGFADIVTDFQEERESLAFFRAWWRSWEIVAAMRGLEEIQVLIGNTNFDIDVLGEDDEAWIVGSWCAIMQIKSLNVGVGWRLFRPETRMSNIPFRDNRS